MSVYSVRHARQRTSAGLIAFVFVLSSFIAAFTPLFLHKIVSAEPYVYNSTNELNKDKQAPGRVGQNAPHVVQTGATTGSVELTFKNPSVSLACFERRIDGQVAYHNGTPADHPLPQLAAAGEKTYPYFCMAAGATDRVETYSASTQVEIRHAFGAEADWRFDWAAFHVLTPPNTGGVSFVNSPKYVRAGNGTDVAGQIVTLDTTTEARFFVDGSSTPIAGYDIGGAGTTTNWWRLATPLPAGEHTLTAEVKIGGDWYPVNGTGTVYSLDLPWAEYVIPQAGQYFRPNDKVVRVKADDEFNQFNRMVTVVNGVSHTVVRADCTDQGSYVLCDLENLNLPEGAYAATTTTYTQANNRVDNLISAPFIVDGTAPAVSNLTIENIQNNFVTTEIKAAAQATDANGVESVNFYLTAPRDDGVCTGNGTKLAEFRQNTPSGDGKYRATLSSAGINGEYCVTATARDSAKNNSNLLHKKVLIDSANPVVSISNLQLSQATKRLSFDLTATDNGPAGLQIVAANIYNQSNTGNPLIQLGSGNPTRLNVPHSGLPVGTGSFSTSLQNIDVSSLPNGTYTIRAYARDHAGNEHRFLLVQFLIDNVNPVATINAPGNGATFGGSSNPSVNFTVNDANIANWSLTGPGLGLSGTTNGTFNHTWNVSGLASGSHTATLTATDRAGNQTTATVQINVDNSAAVTTNINDDDTLNNTGTLTASLGESGTVTVAFLDGDGDPITVTGSSTSSFALGTLQFTFNTRQLDNGDYAAVFTGTDGLGNTTTKSVNFSVLNTTPVASSFNNTNSGVVLATETSPLPPAGLIATQFNNNNPQTLGIATDSSAQSNVPRVKAAETTAKEKEVITQTSTTSAWWVLLIIAVLVAAYYAYRNWRLNRQEAA